MEQLCKIRQIYRAISEFELSFVSEFGVCLNEGMLLCLLAKCPNMTASLIAENLGLTLSNTSKVIKSVEQKCLVSRIVSDTDRRSMCFVLTDSGCELVTNFKENHIVLPPLLQTIFDNLLECRD